ncbi:hypothetical protein Pla163_25970 [Planctomycetes bacterium Pla163]|uniref:Protein BatD n=1 Tax=Rohdeia mirabilis TaxID=2528008 RepID=A0A518D1W6_9BACT|nr:hypothetical protein Pla163_25970 [Planctomycetes bacterium Pla163]
MSGALLRSLSALVLALSLWPGPVLGAPLLAPAHASTTPAPTATAARPALATVPQDAAVAPAFEGILDVWVEAPTDAVEVGQPFELSVVCRHGRDVEVRAAAAVVRDVLTAERGFHVFDVVALPDLPADGARASATGFADGATLVTRITYRVASLSLEPASVEGGGLVWNPERALTGLGVEYAPALADDAPANTERTFEFRVARALDGASAEGDEPAQALVTVRGLIGPGARGPRPMPEPLTTEAEAPLWNRAAWIGGGATFLFLVALVVALRGNRVARASTGPPPDRATVLEGLLEGVASGSVELRQAAFDAVVHVRAGFAERGASGDRSLTDEEWRATLGEDLFRMGEQVDLDRFLARAVAVRYAPARPTRWAIEELIRDALTFERATLDFAGGPSGDPVRASGTATRDVATSRGGAA